MKKLFGIFFALLIFAAPMAMKAEIEATAGSMKVGVHMDLTYRWSAEDNKHPEADEVGWVGYDTISAGDLMIQVTGKVGDRISYKILEGLVYGTFEPALVNYGGSLNALQVARRIGYWGTGESGAIIAKPKMTLYGDALFVAPLEAYVDFQIIDQLKARFGKFIVPTLLANTGVHKADVIHTANPPLIANRGLGFNEMLVDYFLGGYGFPRVQLPLDVTGAGLIGTPLDGLQIDFFVYDEWVNGLGGDAPWYITTADLGYDYNRTKGWDLAATYNRDILGGKFTGRGFYFNEYLDWKNINSWPTPNGRNNGWGLGVNYDHNMFFFGVEYTQDTLSYSENPAPIYVDKKKNTWQGWYAMIGGKFMGGTLQPVYRFDWIDYSNLKNSDISKGPDITSFDTETWHTLALNYLVNDNATVGINYVIKQPEKMKWDGDKIKYPNINEAIIMLELDLL